MDKEKVAAYHRQTLHNKLMATSSLLFCTIVVVVYSDRVVHVLSLG